MASKARTALQARKMLIATSRTIRLGARSIRSIEELAGPGEPIAAAPDAMHQVDEAAAGGVMTTGAARTSKLAVRHPLGPLGDPSLRRADQGIEARTVAMARLGRTVRAETVLAPLAELASGSDLMARTAVAGTMALVVAAALAVAAGHPA
jgi:hypothetical protein